MEDMRDRKTWKSMRRHGRHEKTWKIGHEKIGHEKTWKSMRR